MDWIKTIVGAILGAAISVAGTLFAAMMAVPRTVAMANLKTYLEGVGLSETFLVILGISVSVAGIIILVGSIIWHIRYRVDFPQPQPAADVSQPRPTFTALMFNRSRNVRVEGLTTHNMNGLLVNDTEDVVVTDAKGTADPPNGDKK